MIISEWCNEVFNLLLSLKICTIIVYSRCIVYKFFKNLPLGAKPHNIFHLLSIILSCLQSRLASTLRTFLVFNQSLDKGGQ